MQTRVLFVTRKFPPAVGGMETLAAHTARGLAHLTREPIVIRLGRSQKNLWWFLPYAALRTAVSLQRRAVTHVVCGDAVTYLALRPVLRPRRARYVVMVMGLDLTFPNAIYQRLLRRWLPRADRVVAISDATADAARRAGVPPDRVHVVRLGVESPDAGPEQRAAARARICRRLGLDPSTFILLTLGRLIRRKGVRWFVDAVLPQLPSNSVYLVAGGGPEHETIAEAALAAGTADRVRLLGRVDDTLRDDLLTGADVFVMPNVPVDGDMEGFGLVAIEAALRGTPVVASRLEGIRDAVSDGVTGFLCDPLDAAGYIERLTECARDRARLTDAGARFQSAARATYGLDAFVVNLRSALGLTA